MDDNVRIRLYRIAKFPVYFMFLVILLMQTTNKVFSSSESQVQPTEFRLPDISSATRSSTKYPVLVHSSTPENRRVYGSASEIVLPDRLGLPDPYHLSPSMTEKSPAETIDRGERMALEERWWWESWPWLMIIVSSVSLIGYLLVHSRRLVNIGDTFPDS